MNGEVFNNLLLLGLAAGLIVAAITDLKSREISNWLNLSIAVAAPVFWFASGLDPWPDMAIRLAQALVVFGLFAALFAIGAMGGGDVKLIAAIALWLHWLSLIQLLVVMSIAGGVLTLSMLVHQKIKKNSGQLEVPYGVAISFAGLWVIYERYFNHFA